MGVLRNITLTLCNRCKCIWALITISNLTLIFKALCVLPPHRQKMLGYKMQGGKMRSVLCISALVTSPWRCSSANLKCLHLHAILKTNVPMKGLVCKHPVLIQGKWWLWWQFIYFLFIFLFRMASKMDLMEGFFFFLFFFFFFFPPETKPVNREKFFI